MRPKVTVWVARRAAEQLTPPPRSIIDGSDAASVVRTCCLRRDGITPTGLEVSLMVDEATANRLALACRLDTIWRRKVYPVILAAVTLLAIVFIWDWVRNDSRLLFEMPPVVLAMLFTVLAARFAMFLQRSRHHPTLIKNHMAESSDHSDTAFSISSLKTSIGLRQFNVSRGLPFNSAATLSSSSCVCNDRSVPFGKY